LRLRALRLLEAQAVDLDLARPALEQLATDRHPDQAIAAENEDLPLFDVQNESSSRESADTAEGARGYEGGFYRGSRDMPPSSSIHSTSFSLGAAVPSYWRSPMSHRLTS